MRGRFIFGALAIVTFCPSGKVFSAAATRDYSLIPERNLFGLHEPVVVVKDPVEPPLPKIVLNGVATLGRKLAFLKVQFPPRPGEQQTPQQQGEQSLILSEGQREAGIEVLEINEKTGTIRIRVSNPEKEMTIAFDKDAGKVAKTPPAQPGSPDLAGGGRAMNPGTSGYQRMVPTRTGRQVPAGEPPPLPISTPTPPQTLLQKQSAEKPLTPEEQAILRELEQATQGPRQAR
jgi:hypothetical protein